MNQLASYELSSNFSAAKRRIIYCLVLALIFIGAISFSLQGPFYPAEAERKGISPTQYGFVFGVFQLVILITAPIFGKYMKTIGASFLFKAGLFVCSSCTILFGFLDLSPPKGMFLGLSIAVRIVSALGESSLYTSSYVLVLRSMSGSAIATSLALVEIAFGLGSILGPTVGGGLYEVGGFRLPFVVTGGVLFVGCMVSLILIEEIPDSGKSSGISPSVTKVAKNLPVLILSFSIFSASLTTGFFTALLEPHLRTLGTTPLQVGLVFMTNGATYVIASALCGRLVDKYGHVSVIIITGVILQFLGLTIVGPLPFVPLKKSVASITVGVVLCGLGMGAVLVSAVLAIINELTYCGYPKNMGLQGFVSGLYNALFAAGCFAGPTMGGAVFDAVGFPYSSMVVWGTHILTLVLLLIKQQLRPRGPDVTSRLMKQVSECNGASSLSKASTITYDNMMLSSDSIKTIA